MSHVLVTGGAGFIGSNLVDRLLAEDHRVTAVDDLSRGRLENLAGARTSDAFHFVRADITDPGIDAVVAEARPEVILHLAAQMDVRASVADPVHDAMVNIIGTIRLLEAARRHEARKLVLTTSGGCIYGEPPRSDLPVPETYDGHPHSPYGASKRGVEEYLWTYAALYGLEWTSLALANVYGPRQDPDGEAGVVSIFGGRMLRDEPVTIFGDGEQTRDFVAVGDVVEAFVCSLDAGSGMRVNIGTARETSVNQLFAELADLAGYDRAAQYAEARSGELDHIAVDVRRAAGELGWMPRTGLREGLDVTLSWLRSGGR